MNRNPAPQFPHPTDDETAFLRARLKAVDSYILRLENRLNSEEDLDSPKTQALFRFHNTYLRTHLALKQYESKIQQKRVEQASPLANAKVEQASPLADAKEEQVPPPANARVKQASPLASCFASVESGEILHLS